MQISLSRLSSQQMLDSADESIRYITNDAPFYRRYEHFFVQRGFLDSYRESTILGPLLGRRNSQSLGPRDIGPVLAENASTRRTGRKSVTSRDAPEGEGRGEGLNDQTYRVVVSRRAARPK